MLAVDQLVIDVTCIFAGSPSCVYMHSLQTLHDRQQAFFATVTR